MVTVQCTATGNPPPSVTWTRLNQDKVGHIQDKVGYNQDKVDTIRTREDIIRTR